MSVYKRAGQETYSYDFVVRGRRFSGDTGATEKRAAKRFEDLKRADAKAQIAEQAAFFADRMTFEVAASRWWLEVGQHHQNADTTLNNLEWLKEHIGNKTDLTDITDSIVASLVARRRGERVRRIIKGGKIKEGELVGPATVNRTCTQPLREIITRARKVWKVKVAEVDFGRHMLAEPQERVREASIEEEAAIIEELGRGYDVAVRFAFLTGCRRMEILGLEWTRVDFFNRQFTVIGKGKKARTLPMSQAIYELLWEERNFHQVKVFTYVAQKASKRYKLERGRRYPLTESGLKSAMRRAVPRAGVENFHFHDTRHTAATRVLRKSNLRVAQILLGHSDVKTTTKYAHALNEDIRAALEAAGSPTQIPTNDEADKDKPLANNRKRR